MKTKISKYRPLWEYLRHKNDDSQTLSFEEIKDILNFEIDHSFLKYKKEAEGYGYKVGKISLKEKKIVFMKIN